MKHVWSGLYRRYGQGVAAAEHAAAASEVVPVLSLSSSPVERGGLRTAGVQRTACSGQSCAEDAESRYFRALPTGAGRAASRGASRQQPRARRQAQMAGNKQTRLEEESSGTKEPAGGLCGRPRERGLWSGEVVSSRAALFFPSSLAHIGRLAVSLYYVKRTSQARGHWGPNRVGDSRQKRLQRSGAVHVVPQYNETWCYPRYPCAGVAQGALRTGGRVCMCMRAAARRARRSYLTCPGL